MLYYRKLIVASGVIMAYNAKRVCNSFVAIILKVVYHPILITQPFYSH